MNCFKAGYKSDVGKAAVISKYDEILAHWPVPYQELWVDTSFGRTYIICCGEEHLPPLLLLHGTCSNSAMWIGDVSKYTQHYKVYAVDIPGEPGKSEDKQYSLKGPVYSEWLNEIISHLNLEKPAMVGISLGAWLALSFAVRYPEKPDSLVLMCPSGISPQRLSFMIKAMFLSLRKDKGLNRMGRLIAGNEGMSPETIDYMILIAQNFNLRFEKIPLFSDLELSSLDMPVLLLAGEKDVLLDSEKTVGRAGKLLPHAKTCLLKDKGHVLIGLTDVIIDFLGET